MSEQRRVDPAVLAEHEMIFHRMPELVHEGEEVTHGS
jgi:hypothetical protein